MSATIDRAANSTSGRLRFFVPLLFCAANLALSGCSALVTSNNTNSQPAAPSIKTQPASQTVTTGQKASFNVAAAGTAPLSYQWKRNGAAISGATSSSYTTPVTTSADNGAQFAVVVSDTVGSATSNPATLTVTASATAPSITTQPTNQTVTTGQTATFSVAATGTAPLSYQWKKNGAAISGAISTSYTTPATTSSDNGAQFTVVVSNSAGSATSNPATLTVNASATAPSITTQPLSLTVVVGQAATFTVAATGTAPLSYQWKKNGAAISGATSSSYTTPATTSSDNGAQFTVVVSNSAGSATSNPATLTVNATATAPSITTQPASQTVTAGLTATFTVAATGTAPLSYQWNKNGTAISGATSSTYKTPATTSSDNGAQFTVAVSNTAGNVTSNPATLTVNADTTPPTVPTGLTASAVSSSQINLSWKASTDNVAVTGYDVFRGGSQIASTASTSYSDTGLTASTNYSYTVAAFDAAGNTSAQSSSASATTLGSGGGGSSGFGLGWNEIPGTAFGNICPSTSTFTGIGGSETCKGVTDDWNGGWADWKRQRLEWWGGGHAGYYGNEVYFFDILNRSIGRYTDPASNPTSQCSGTPLQNSVWQNTTPNVPHGYAGMAYVGDGFDQMFYSMGDLSRGTNTCPASAVNSANGIRADSWTFNLLSINQGSLPNPAGSWTPLDTVTGGAGITRSIATGCAGGCTNPGWGHYAGSVGNSGVGEYASTQTDQRTDLVYISDGVSMYQWSPASPNTAQELAEGGNVKYFNGCATGTFIDTDAGTFVIYGNCGIRRFHIDATTGTKWTTDNLDNSTTGCSVRGGGLSIGADYDYVQHVAVLWGAAGQSTQIIQLFNPKDTAVTVNYAALGLSNHTVNPLTCETYTAPLSNTSNLPSLVPTQSGGTGEWGRFRFFHDVAQQDVFATCNNKDTNCFVLALNSPAPQVGSVSFANRCAASGVIKCIGLDSAADAPQDVNNNGCAVGGLPTMPCLLPDSNGAYQGHIDTTVAASGGGSLRFDVPGSAGQNSSGELRLGLGGRFGPPGSAATNGTTFYVQFRFRMDANYAALWKAWAANGEGQKIFAVLNEDSSGGSTCQSEAIVYQNIFYRGYPQAGTNCVNIGLYEGTSPNIKYENGADYQCMQNQAATDSSCVMMTWHPNEWYTFYCKYVLAQWDANAASGWNTGHNTIQCWVAREGQPLKQFMNFTAFPLQFQNSLATSGYNALKFYPYDTRRTGGNVCGSGNTQPCAPGKMWYDEVIVSTQPIPAPDGPTPPQ